LLRFERSAQSASPGCLYEIGTLGFFGQKTAIISQVSHKTIGEFLIADCLRDHVTYFFFFQPPSFNIFNTCFFAQFAQTMAFKDDYGHIIAPFLKKYNLAKNEKSRKAVIKNAANAVTSSSDLLENGGKSIPKDLETVILFIMFPFYNLSLIFLLLRQYPTT
jgi:hypothetical protein